MKMNRITVILVMAFALTFVAGGSMGLLAGADEGPGASAGTARGLDRELGLTPAQREQMRSIWSNVLDGRERELRQRRQELWERRIAALESLLNEQQRAQYGQFLGEYQRGMQQVDQEWRDLLSQAVQRTRQTLTPPQMRRYDEIRGRRLFGGRGMGPPPGGPRPFGPRSGLGDRRPPHAPMYKGREPFSRPGRGIDGPPRGPGSPPAPNSPEP